jgi:hypothetical protein
MGFLKKLMFYAGLLLGMASAAAVGAAALTYLFTGKIPTVKMEGDGKGALTLMTPDEVAEFVRQKVEEARAAGSPKAEEEAAHGQVS